MTSTAIQQALGPEGRARRAFRRAIRAVTLLLASAFLPAYADQLTVAIRGIDRVTGALMIAVYNSPATWNASEGAVAQLRQTISGNAESVVFSGLKPGSYAVMLYHDENGNGELDSNMLGIPSEGYGFSNNVGRYGRPDFEEALIVIDGDTSIEIDLH